MPGPGVKLQKDDDPKPKRRYLPTTQITPVPVHFGEGSRVFLVRRRMQVHTYLGDVEAEPGELLVSNARGCWVVIPPKPIDPETGELM